MHQSSDFLPLSVPLVCKLDLSHNQTTGLLFEHRLTKWWRLRMCHARPYCFAQGMMWVFTEAALLLHQLSALPKPGRSA